MQFNKHPLTDTLQELRPVPRLSRKSHYSRDRWNALINGYNTKPLPIY